MTDTSAAPGAQTRTHARAFVRKEMLPTQPAPVSERGAVKWMRENLFSSPLNAFLTVASIVVVVWVVAHVAPWAWNGIWQAGSLTECREIRDARGLDSAACWAVVTERWPQLLFGFYPTNWSWIAELFYAEELAAAGGAQALFTEVASRDAATAFTNMMRAETSWPVLLIFGYTRPMLAFVLLCVAVAPILYASLPRKMLWFSLIYPLVGYYLLWGGSVWGPIIFALAFVVGWLGWTLTEKLVGTLGALLIALAATLGWWLFVAAPLTGALTQAMPLGLAYVQSNLFGGFMLAIIIGVTGIVLSLPLGVLLALGRQSDLFIINITAVTFIEVIRGVPLIVWLFTASLLLNLFLPPGTKFDLILRVIIMVTLFASAYMAEVVRGGLAALPKGQYEAADSLGLDYWKSMRLIILPQAMKISIPGIVNTFIGLFKDTTLVVFIGLLDPIGLSNTIRASSEWNGIYWELFVFIGILFFVFCYFMSRYSQYLEQKLQTDHR